MAGGCTLSEPGRAELCRNTAAATHLKVISLGVIFVASAVGILSPVLLARLFRGKSAYDRALLVIKCFAAGVILSTSLVHVLPDAFEALADCQVSTRHPWRDFPFSGLVCLVGALLALLVDIVASSHVDAASVTPSSQSLCYEPLGKGSVKADPTVQMGGCHQRLHHEDVVDEGEGEVDGDEEERLIRAKQKMVSKVLEIGIIFHLVIIGVTMGMSQNQCTIRPLVVALCFHQVFEGMGLGGCIAQ